MSEHEDDLLNKMLLIFGEEFQYMMFSEEMGELLTAVSHRRRGRIPPEEVAKEIADVRLMIKTVMPILDVTESMVQAQQDAQLQKIAEKVATGNQNYGANTDIDDYMENE